jgi:S1-C subfamily serine protease
MTDEERLRAIRLAAAQLQEDVSDDVVDAEALAAIEEGTISFEDLNEDFLKESVARTSVEHYSAAFVAAHKARIEKRAVDSQPNRVLAMPPASAPPSTNQVPKPLRSRQWMAWGAIAATLLMGAAIRWQLTRQKPDQQIAQRPSQSPQAPPGQTPTPDTSSATLPPNPEVATQGKLPTEGPSKSPSSGQVRSSGIIWSEKLIAGMDLKPWAASSADLAKGPIQDGRRVFLTLGSGSRPKWWNWVLATVIVDVGEGWGSGSVISPDGWILTNYHVVDSSVQKATLKGELATVQIVVPHRIEDRVKALEAVPGTVYRVDPVHDLALIKVSRLPAGVKALPYLPLAQAVKLEEPCTAIGSPGNGPSWSAKTGRVSTIFDFPSGLSQNIVGQGSEDQLFERTEMSVIESDTGVSNGDSGGPLVNDEGKIIGITFSSPENRRNGSSGWHIDLKHVRDFVAKLPTQPEGVPFDVWTAGDPELELAKPYAIDLNDDGQKNAVLLFHSSKGEGQNFRLSAQTIFLGPDALKATTDALLPKGIWGLENRGNFAFDIFYCLRNDGVVATGHTNAQGIVDDIRIGRGNRVDLRWRRQPSGLWISERANGSEVPFVDEARLGSRTETLNRFLLAAKGEASNSGVNKK